jgi:hypothetical protein
MLSVGKQAAEKLPSETESVPQGLKPHCKQNTCGTAEAVPLSKTDFSAAGKAQRVDRACGAETQGKDLGYQPRPFKNNYRAL